MAGELYLLDTNILVVLDKGKALGTHIATTFELTAKLSNACVCIVTHGELSALSRVNDFTEAQRENIETMLDSLVTVDINDELVIESYAVIYEALRKHPKGSRANVGENDMWIAAATRATGATLLTLDTDFDALPLEVINRIHISSKPPFGPTTHSV
jgi:predicted nucleic acid-binding protein